MPVTCAVFSSIQASTPSGSSFRVMNVPWLVLTSLSHPPCNSRLSVRGHSHALTCSRRFSWHVPARQQHCLAGQLVCTGWWVDCTARSLMIKGHQSKGLAVYRAHSVSCGPSVFRSARPEGASRACAVFTRCSQRSGSIKAGNRIILRTAHLQIISPCMPHAMVVRDGPFLCSWPLSTALGTALTNGTAC